MVIIQGDIQNSDQFIYTLSDTVYNGIPVTWNGLPTVLDITYINLRCKGQLHSGKLDLLYS